MPLALRRTAARPSPGFGSKNSAKHVSVYRALRHRRTIEAMPGSAPSLLPFPVPAELVEQRKALPAGHCGLIILGDPFHLGPVSRFLVARIAQNHSVLIEGMKVASSSPIPGHLPCLSKRFSLDAIPVREHRSRFVQRRCMPDSARNEAQKTPSSQQPL